MHKQWTILCLAAALALLGCAPGSGAEAQADKETPPSLSGPGTPGGSDGYYGIVWVGEGQTLESSGDAGTDGADVNAVLVEQGGEMKLTDTKLTKTGDASGTTASAGGNAAIAVRSGGQLHMENSAITTEGFGAHGLYGDGANTYLAANGVTITTKGATSAGVFVNEAANMSIQGGSIVTEDGDGTSPAVLLAGGGQVKLDGVEVRTSGSLAESMSGVPALDLYHGAYTGDVVTAEDAGIEISLQQNAVWTGIVRGETAQGITVSLDKDSRWVLTGDTTLETFRDGDETLGNIQSDGYTIYYSFDSEGNAWLNGQTLALPGGGYLTPIL